MTNLIFNRNEIAVKKRIALIGIYHESNTFISRKTNYQNFVDSHLLKGADIREEYLHAYHEIGGILEIFDDSDMVIDPLLFAEATPGGIIENLCFEKLAGETMDLLQARGPWDGVMICAHGAAVAENLSDTDGEWLARVRKVVGDEVPIVCTIDPHANVSKKMVGATDAMVAYSTNPHLDQRETGIAAAELMLSHLRKEVKLVQSYCPTSVSISIEQQATAEEPCAVLYDKAKEIEQIAGVLSVSVVLGFPYSDVEKMGSSFIVVTDGDLDKAVELSNSLGNYLEDNRHLFVGMKVSPEDAVNRSRKLDKPVLLLDMGDNVGGGSPGDSTILLNEILNERDVNFFVCLYDPEAVVECERVGVGGNLEIFVGGKTDRWHGKPLLLKLLVEKIEDGLFRESEPRHGGQVKYNMGRTIIAKTSNGSTLMLISKRIPPFSLSQLTTFGINPETFDVIIAKGVQAPVAAYAPVCPSLIRVNTPGVTCADATQLSFEFRRRPLFPFEDWE